MTQLYKITFENHKIDILEKRKENNGITYDVWLNDKQIDLTPEEEDGLLGLFFNLQEYNEAGVQGRLMHEKIAKEFWATLINSRLKSIDEEDFFTIIGEHLELNKNYNPNFKEQILSSYNEIKKATLLEQNILKANSTNIAVSLICAKACETLYKGHGFIQYSVLKEILKQVKNTKAKIYENKLSNGFPFSIPSLVNKKTKEAEDKVRDGEEYYNPFQQIIDAKNTNLFKDFIIIHYDKRSDEVKEAEAKARDPIVFGVLRGDLEIGRFMTNDIKPTAQLVYITDWKDKYCNLTIEEFIKRAKGVNIKTPTLDKGNTQSLTESLIKSLLQELENDLPETQELKKILQSSGVLSDGLFEKLKRLFKKERKNSINL
jgi:hypothetical protein